MIITSKLTMDLSRPGVLPVIPAAQDDTGSRALEITLCSHGKPWKIPGDASAVIRYCKADGTAGAYDTLPDGTKPWIIRGNQITVLLAPQVLTVPGTVRLIVSLVAADRQISLFPIVIQVTPAAEGTMADSQDYYYVRGFLPAPKDAAVGEYLRVAGVNSQGKVTAVEAVPLSGSGEEVPDYWLSALRAGARAINTALCQAGCRKSAFLFYTDAHWNYGAKITPRLLKFLHRHTGMTRTIFGGDIVNDEGSDYDTMAYLWDWREQLKDLPNHHSVVGNHDDGNATNNLFTGEYVYGYLLGAEETADVVRDEEGMYYFIDCPAEKTRYLYLDTAYQGATENQCAFVKNALLTAPENWHIVAIAHIWHDTDYTVSPPVPAGMNAHAAVFLDLFDCFNARTGDFSGCSAKVEFCIGGHTHWDHTSRTAGGIPIVLMEADGWAVRSGLSCTPGTTTEASVSGIIADYAAGTIRIIRIGRGLSRTVGLTDPGQDSEEIPGEDTGGDSGGEDSGDSGTTYTNLLLSAVDNDGNPCPWKENTRWSGSSGAEVASTGTYLSGHIPYTPGQTVYLKNVTLLNQNGSGVIHYFSAPGVRIDGVHVNDAVNYWSGVTDQNNMVTQFTMFINEAYADVKYIRIECTGFDSTSIVTVDEPIE